MRTDILSGALLERATRDLAARLKRGHVAIAPDIAAVFGQSLARLLDRRSVKACADDIADTLALLGTPACKDLILEAIAAYRGARDWNTLSGLLPAEPTGPRWTGKTLTLISGPTGSTRNPALRKALEAMIWEKEMAAQVPVSTGLHDEGRKQRFQAAINAALRSDPDVTLLGEVRTEEDSHGAPVGTHGISVITLEDPVEYIVPGWVEPPQYDTRRIPLRYVPRGIRQGKRPGGHVVHVVLSHERTLITNLPVDSIPAEIRSWCQSVEEVALIAATLLAGGTLRHLGPVNRSFPFSTLERHAKEFCTRFLMPLMDGQPAVFTADAVAAWMRSDGVWWWRHCEDEPGTEYA